MSNEIPRATVERLPRYLKCLEQLIQHKRTISSTELAHLANLSPAQLRKDLSQLGSYGIRGVGYDVEQLQGEIRRELGLTRDWPVIVVGVGNLGSALAAYGGFGNRGFEIAGLYDVDPDRIGDNIQGIEIRSLDRVGRDVAARRVAIGIITTPAVAAQSTADVLVAAGISSILNFAPAVISVPSHVELRQVDLSTELQILAFYLQSRSGESAPRPRDDEP